MITKLRAQNFKSWQDTGDLRFAPITGFFGANSSGKTSILQVLLMLKQTTERPPDWNEPLYFGDEHSLANLGSFDDVIHRSGNGISLGISVSWRVPEKKMLMNTYELDVLHFYFNLHNKSVGRFSYQVGEHCFEILPEGPGHNAITPIGKGRIQSLFRCYGIRDLSPSSPPADFTQRFFSGLEETFENLFARIHYLGPLRDNPRHQYTWEGDHPGDIGQRGEKAIPALLSDRIQLRSIEKKILEWLQRLDLIDSYRLEPNLNEKGRYEFHVTKHKGGPEVRLTDVGFGISQVLPVLTHCYHPPEGSILILEQPEAHLHPKAQSELADVLIDVAKNRKVQIIFESHSEHLLHRLMRRIAEEQLSATDTAFYSCQIKEGVSEIEHLKLDEYGNISNWPQDFFGDVTGDLIEQTKAEMDRRETMR